MEAWSDHAIAFIDVETTGLTPGHDRIVELAIVIGCKRTIVSTHSWLINPGRSIPASAQAIHGISDSDVHNCPSFVDVAEQVAYCLSLGFPAAYNAPFDRGFLVAEFDRIQHVHRPPSLTSVAVWIDPLVWARAARKDKTQRCRLVDVAGRCGIPVRQAHRATGDSIVGLRVLYALCKEVYSYETFMKRQQALS